MTVGNRTGENVTVGKPLQGRVAVVTGGGRGIGVGIARALATDGADIALVSRTAADLAKVQAELEALGVRVASIVADVTDEAQVQRAFSTIDAIFGRVDILANNAGIVRVRAFLSHDLAAWDDTFNGNVRSVFLCSRAAAHLMVRDGRGGRIMSTGSHYADEAHEGFAAYCASKAAVEAVTRNLALELAPHRITVNAVRVGPVTSTLFSEERSHQERAAIRAGLAESGHKRGSPPLGGPGHPNDVGAVIAFLASDAAAWITGTSIHVDGGIHLR